MPRKRMAYFSNMLIGYTNGTVKFLDCGQSVKYTSLIMTYLQKQNKIEPIQCLSIRNNVYPILVRLPSIPYSIPFFPKHATTYVFFNHITYFPSSTKGIKTPN